MVASVMRFLELFIGLFITSVLDYLTQVRIIRLVQLP